VTASRPWLGISTPSWLIKSDTPQFAELTNRKLRRSAHRSVTELEADIRKWINAWYKNPRPYEPVNSGV
jgi:hypothetical protein